MLNRGEPHPPIKAEPSWIMVPISVENQGWYTITPCFPACVITSNVHNTVHVHCVYAHLQCTELCILH